VSWISETYLFILIGSIYHKPFYQYKFFRENQLSQQAIVVYMEEIDIPSPDNSQGQIKDITDNFARLESLDHVNEHTGFQFGGRSSWDNFQFMKEDGAEGLEMDGDLWGELSEHLMENIFAKLPVLCFLRLRSVCKKWNALISNPLFLENCSRAEASGCAFPPLFLLYADHARQSYPTYDPASNSWYLLPQTLSSSLSGKSITASSSCAFPFLPWPSNCKIDI
jgi:hypothetical protein